jgi:hypothetical protein
MPTRPRKILFPHRTNFRFEGACDSFGRVTRCVAGAREMLSTKLMLEPVKEILENRDYYGYNIYDENAPQGWSLFFGGDGLR